MTYNRNKYLLMLLLITAVFAGCKKQWDQRNDITDQQLDKTLIQQIQESADLSVFAGYLTKIGYDKLLASSKTFTVWAPTNAALASIDPAIVADTAKLHVFVNNHIANQVFLTTAAQPSLRIVTLNGKSVTFTATGVEEASITGANQYVRNGVVHVINKPLTPKMNINEFVRSLTTVGLLQKAYLLRQDTTFVDTSKATVASIDPKTGKPILVAGTGVVTRNKYFNRVGDISSESKQYTYFVLTDDAYNTERGKVSKYFNTVTGSVDTTMNILAGFNVLKDMLVDHMVLPGDLKDTLRSVNGVTIPINKANIVQTYSASNGIVYVMSAINFDVTQKIPTITIEGEKPSFYARTDQGSKVNVRLRTDPAGVRFNDLFITGANLPASYFAAYKLSNLNTCQYKVYVRAVNDTSITKATISQQVLFSQITATTVVGGTITPTYAVTFPYVTMTPNNYADVQSINATGVTTTAGTINVAAGTLNVLKNASIYMYVRGANTTATNTNNILVDYIKLVPIIQ